MLEYPRIFFPIFFALNEQKKIKQDCVRALSTGWDVLKQSCNALKFWVYASFPYTEN